MLIFDISRKKLVWVGRIVCDFKEKNNDKSQQTGLRCNIKERGGLPDFTPSIYINVFGILSPADFFYCFNFLRSETAWAQNFSRDSLYSRSVNPSV